MLKNTINNKSSPGRGGRKYHDTSLTHSFFSSVWCGNLLFSLCWRRKVLFGWKVAEFLIKCLQASSIFRHEDSIKFLLKILCQLNEVLILNNCQRKMSWKWQRTIVGVWKPQSFYIHYWWLNQNYFLEL